MFKSIHHKKFIEPFEIEDSLKIDGVGTWRVNEIPVICIDSDDFFTEGKRYTLLEEVRDNWDENGFFIFDDYNNYNKWVEIDDSGYLSVGCYSLIVLDKYIEKRNNKIDSILL